MELSSITYRMPYANVVVQADENILREPSALNHVMTNVVKEQAKSGSTLNLYNQLLEAQKTIYDLRAQVRRNAKFENEFNYCQQRYERLKRKYFAKHYKESTNSTSPNQYLRKDSEGRFNYFSFNA